MCTCTRGYMIVIKRDLNGRKRKRHKHRTPGMGCARLLLSHWHPLLLLPLDDICLEAQEDEDPRTEKKGGGKK